MKNFLARCLWWATAVLTLPLVLPGAAVAALMSKWADRRNKRARKIAWDAVVGATKRELAPPLWRREPAFAAFLRQGRDNFLNSLKGGQALSPDLWGWPGTYLGLVAQFTAAARAAGWTQAGERDVQIAVDKIYEALSLRVMLPRDPQRFLTALQELDHPVGPILVGLDGRDAQVSFLMFKKGVGDGR